MKPRDALDALDTPPNYAQLFDLTDGLPTMRKRQVATLVALGLPNSVIAQRLGITEKAVKFHLSDIYKAMGLNSRLELAVYLWAC